MEFIDMSSTRCPACGAETVENGVYNGHDGKNC